VDAIGKTARCRQGIIKCGVGVKYRHNMLPRLAPACHRRCKSYSTYCLSRRASRQRSKDALSDRQPKNFSRNKDSTLSMKNFNANVLSMRRNFPARKASANKTSAHTCCRSAAPVEDGKFVRYYDAIHRPAALGENGTRRSRWLELRYHNVLGRGDCAVC